MPPGAAPAWPAGAVPAAAASAPAGPARPSGPSRWWGEATSSDGGRAALIVVAILGALLLVTGIGLVVALASHGGWGRDERVSMGNQWGPGNGMGQGNRQGKGNGNGPGMGNRNRGQAAPDDDFDDDGLGGGMGNGLGNGMGMGRGGMPGAGAVLHGEFTTSLTGTPTVMVFQTGQVTAYTAGKSVTVRSTDGFEGTYALDASTTATTRSAARLATGSQVYVLAAKEGMKVTRLAVVG